MAVKTSVDIDISESVINAMSYHERDKTIMDIINAEIFSKCKYTSGIDCISIHSINSSNIYDNGIEVNFSINSIQLNNSDVTLIDRVGDKEVKLYRINPMTHEPGSVREIIILAHSKMDALIMVLGCQSYHSKSILEKCPKIKQIRLTSENIGIITESYNER